MKIIIAAAAALSLSSLNTFVTSQDDAFQKVAHDYVEQYLQANPEQATELGDHRFDGKLTDYSAETRAKDLATQKESRDKLNAIDGSQLTGANNIDFRILKENIDYEIFGTEELKEPEWNPLVYMQSLANSLYLLVARDFAPAHGKNPGGDRASKSQSATSAAHSHRDGDRANAGRNQSRAQRTRPSTRSGA